MAGLRVVRGPDWKWGDQDGGEGYCGTTTSRQASVGWVHVIWDNGRKSDYRTGSSDASDLLLLDNGPAGVFHKGVMCDACKENDVRGIRWKCVDCPDYDLCTECYGDDKHDLNHRFKRIVTPGVSGDNVGRRRNAVKIQSRGLYTGATVTRGEDWMKDDQDGGAGSVGTVTQVGYIKESGMDKPALVVRWPHDKATGYIYRRGLGGKVDVKHRTAAVGWNFYRDHLPQLRNADQMARKSSASSGQDDLGELLAKLLVGGLMEGATQQRSQFQSSQKKDTMRNFSIGDLVRLHHDMDTVQKLQEGHGGFNILMIPALGKTGIVADIDGDGDLKVRFGGVDWTVNPAAVTRQTVPKEKAAPAVAAAAAKPKNRFKAGDRVIISADKVTIKALQIGHGGWNDALNPFTGTGVVGIVREVDGNNDLLVGFGNNIFVLNPAVCSIAPKVGRTISGGSTGPKFSIGDRVKIDRDIDFVKRSQQGHGGWHDSMKRLASSSGLVKGIDDDGDLQVSMGANVWTLNPEICHRDTSEFNSQASAAAPPKKKNLNKNVNASVPTGRSINVGDAVRLDKDKDFVQRMQQGHGGWNDQLKEDMTKVGQVEGIDDDGDLQVRFGNKTWTLNPEVCHLVGSPGEKRGGLKVGDQVQLPSDVALIKRLQKDHGGWDENMRNVLSQVGRIVDIDSDGDVLVDFGGKSWTFNPELCQRPQGGGATGQTRRKSNTNVDGAAAASGGEPSTSSGAGASWRTSDFNVDDQVKITVSAERLKTLQTNHGGWSEAMRKAIGPIGSLKNIDDNGDLYVKFPSGTFTLNPAACVSLNPKKHKEFSGQPSQGSSQDAASRLKEKRESAESKFQCSICFDQTIAIVFNCGHNACDECSKSIDECHICRQKIALRTKIFLS